MEEQGYGVKEKFPGVYHISGMADIKMQVVVGNELVGDEFTSLRVQKPNASDEDVRRFLKMYGALTDHTDKEMADAIMQVSISENKSLYDKLKETDNAREC